MNSKKISHKYDKNKLFDHINFLCEWLYEPLDEDFENKLYFIENSHDIIDKDLTRIFINDFYYGLRYNKL
jgi:hypothetical protein